MEVIETQHAELALNCGIFSLTVAEGELPQPQGQDDPAPFQAVLDLLYEGLDEMEDEALESEGVRAHIRTLDVCALPRRHEEFRTFTVTVEWRGYGWAVIGRIPHQTLSRAGTWDWETSDDRMDEAFLAQHRFTLKEALRLAREQALTMEVMGKTAPDFLKEMEEPEEDA